MNYISYFTEKMNEPEFTPEQIEAQEAMMEAYELPKRTDETIENTPKYWQKKAEQELYENGDSDAFREFSEKAQAQKRAASTEA